MLRPDSEYLMKRALQCEELARGAATPAIANLHRAMAREYRARAFEHGVSPA